jgi:hypothetical protein
LRAKKGEWEGEREADKKKLEYVVYDLLKLVYANKDQLKRIRAIFDES